MKRPLCIIAFVITVAVYLYLEFHLSDLITGPPDELNGRYTEVTGFVADKGVYKSYSGEYLPVIYIETLEQVSSNSKYIQCYMEQNAAYEPSIGEYVRIGGKISIFPSPRNPGEFDSRLYYSTLKISYRIKNANIVGTAGTEAKHGIKEKLYRMRERLEEALDSCLDESDSAVMKGMLLGDKAYLDSETKDMYKNSGIIHILAVSGLHISILGMGLYGLLKKFGINKYISVSIPLVIMYLYGMMCGMSTSAFRAILMFALRLLSPVLKRTYDMLSGLALAEILLVIEQPLYLYNSGFLFSFGAIIGIAVVRPRLAEMVSFGKDSSMRFVDEKKPGYMQRAFRVMQDGLIAGVSILIVTLPVYTSFYYTYPIMSLFLNLLVIPMMGILMIAGILCIAVAMLIPAFGILPGFAVHFILNFYKLLCELGTHMPVNTLYLGHSDKVRVAIYYILVAAGLFGAEYLLKAINSFLKATIILPLTMIFIAIFCLCFHIPPEFRMTMIDVGQGDGILITVKDKNVLIDGGSTSKSNVGKYSIIPYLKYEATGELDAVVLTHEDKDHVNGILDIMDDMEKGGIRVKRLILPDIADESKGESYQKLENRAYELGISTIYISEGDKFSAGDAEFLCLNPEEGRFYGEANEYSTVLFMKYKGLTALLTGDVEGAGQEHIRKVIEESDSTHDITILKVAHHGSQYTTDEEFLDLINPQIALISCGVDNSYGHPHNELLERLDLRNIRIYRTDESGAVIFTLKRGRLVVEEMWENN